jgi:hypothetical protein
VQLGLSKKRGKIMKKTLLCALLLALCLGMAPAALAVSDNTQETAQPITAQDLNDGTYEITVQSSSSMFRIVEARLTVDGDQMTVAMTLGGTGYEKLYMGTGDSALTASEDAYYYFVEGDDGAYTYTVPIEALDQDTDCAAFSIRKQSWYDRVLVFQSDLLPEEAYKSQESLKGAVIALVASAVVMAALGFGLDRRKP